MTSASSSIAAIVTPRKAPGRCGFAGLNVESGACSDDQLVVGRDSALSWTREVKLLRDEPFGPALTLHPFVSFGLYTTLVSCARIWSGPRCSASPKPPPLCASWKRKRAVWWAHLGLPGHRLHADWRFSPGDGPELVVRSQLERKLPAPGRHIERQPQLGERLDKIYRQREEFRPGSKREVQDLGHVVVTPSQREVRP